jgi:hypothetical protein
MTLCKEIENGKSLQCGNKENNASRESSSGQNGK